MTPRIAVVDDEPRLGKVLAMVLRQEGWEVEAFDDPRAFLETLADQPRDLVFSDLKMPHVDGLGVLNRVKEASPETPVILLTAHGTVATAIEAMKGGAADYLTKPFDNAEVVAIARRCLDHTRLARENRRLRAELRSRHAPGEVIAVSEPMQQVFELVRRAARSLATVLITGESGTGKELVARSVHYWSDRVGGPFEAVNCKAFASGVLESELFGHEAGAFSGATRRRPGVFERAEGGTVFLDELGETDLDFQAKLLRVLQEREVQPVGADKPRPVDVRIVSATNRDLRAEVEAGRFREDLFFRLAVIPVHLAPLRERRADILPLARRFLQRSAEGLGRTMAGWDAEVEAALLSHGWPGNVRELENAMERAAVLARDETLSLDDIFLGVPSPQRGSSAPGDETLQESLDRVTVERIQATLAATDGRRAEAAERLGIDRTTLYRLMKKHGLSGRA